jgi:uncharacterized membrane protein YfcA
MRNLIVLGFVGLFAQLVDGSLGMAYGVTSSTMLLAAGQMQPRMVIGTVSASEFLVSLGASVGFLIGLGAQAIAWDAVAVLLLGGVVAAPVAAWLVRKIDHRSLGVVVAGMILVTNAERVLGLGVYVIWRFLVLGGRRPTFSGSLSKRFLAPLGLFAGAMDAIGGGGWGPVGTTSLLSSGRLEPRKVVGSIDTSEFVVAVGGSLGFLFALGSQGINLEYAAALFVGGAIAAPFAAWLVRHLPARVLGVAAGGLIVLTNSQTILGAVGLTGWGLGIAAIVVAIVWVSLIVWAVRQERHAVDEVVDMAQPVSV